MATLRAFGRTVLPRGRLRSALNSLLLAIEWRIGVAHTIAGRRFRFLPGSVPAADDMYAPVAELDALQLSRFAQSLQAGDVVADVGAYRGVYAAVAAAIVGERGHVYAFEPMAANIEVMRRNLELNGVIDRVMIISCAVAAERGTATFFTAGTSSANSMLRGAIEPLAAGHLQTLQVPTCTLDDELITRDIHPDVVKIDVEGAEFAVLRGAEAIVRSRAQIFCELHPYAWSEAGHSGEELRDWLKQRGRTMRHLESDAEVTTWRYGPVQF